MEQMNPDQFEKYLENNVPMEEPSGKVLENLQREAVWNQPSSLTNKLWPIILLIGILFWIFLPVKNTEKLVDQKSETAVPVLEEIKYVPSPIALNDTDFEEEGMYKFMKFRSDDFNLCLHEDDQKTGLLSISRELNNI
jgi:hypothetical protein